MTKVSGALRAVRRIVVSALALSALAGAAQAQVTCPATPSQQCLYSSNFSRLRLQTGVFLWKYRRGNFEAGPAGDPINSTDYAVCIYNDGQLLKSMQIPHGGICRGHACWHKLDDRGWSYGNADGSADGINWVKMKLGPRKAIMKVKGRGDKVNFPLPLTVTTAVTMQMHNSDGHCWQAIFPTPAKRQGPDAYDDATGFLTYEAP